jgi:transmembrane sensor
MERRYNVTIEVQNDEIKEYQLTGIFYNENIEQSLQLLQVIAPFKFKRTNDKILIYK